METGKIIKELRIKKGLTQEELADKTEVSARTIQRIENGEVDPRAYTLQMIARALEVDYSIFLEQEPDSDEEIQKVDNSNWLGLLHLSGILPLIFPTVWLWNHKKDKVKGITEHYKVIISSQLMILGIALGCLWVYWKGHQITPFIGILLMNALFSIVNAVKVMNGEPYKRMPFMKRKKRSEV